MSADELRAADAIEAAAYRDMYAAAPPALAAQLGLAVRKLGDATLLIARGIPDPFFNRVSGLGSWHPGREDDRDADRLEVLANGRFVVLGGGLGRRLLRRGSCHLLNSIPSRA